ncbi:hypothetical protein F4801DRAFT_198718 [Xylaria longipes]|nr:hypothetical protein F4801DRAFT_198718 [Xylaria longipes]
MQPETLVQFFAFLLKLASALCDEAACSRKESCGRREYRDTSAIMFHPHLERYIEADQDCQVPLIGCSLQQYGEDISTACLKR